MFVKQIENGLEIQEITNNIAAIYDTSLLPGKSIQPHFHPDFEELYYVLSGYGLMTLGEEKQEISRGDVVYIPSLEPHTLLNTGNVPLRFVTITVRISRNKKEESLPYIG